jgi:hypothetical protein
MSLRDGLGGEEKSVEGHDAKTSQTRKRKKKQKKRKKKKKLFESFG